MKSTLKQFIAYLTIYVGLVWSNEIEVTDLFLFIVMLIAFVPTVLLLAHIIAEACNKEEQDIIDMEDCEECRNKNLL